jgi:hypothetical protein
MDAFCPRPARAKSGIKLTDALRARNWRRDTITVMLTRWFKCTLAQLMLKAPFVAERAA